MISLKQHSWHTVVRGLAVTLGVLSLMACSGGNAGNTTAPADDCVPEHEFETIEAGKLTVASYDYPPMTLITDDGITGWEGDVLTDFAERNCLALEVSSAGGAGAVIPSIETGRADVGAGSWYRTDEREKIVRLSAPTVIDASAIVSLEGLTSDDLVGKRVGSVSGNLWNESLQSWLGDDFVIYQDDESIYGDLAAGRIDAIVPSAASALTRFESNPIEGAEVVITSPNEHVPEFERPGQINFPSTLENEALGEALDSTIIAMRDDGSLAEIIESYGLDAEIVEIDEVWNL